MKGRKVGLLVAALLYLSCVCKFERLASVAGAAIQAIGRPEFEDGLWTGVHLEDSWCPSRVCTKPVVNMAPFLTLGAQPAQCRSRFPRSKVDQML